MVGELLIVGVDGGGSGCRAAIATTDQRIIGRGQAGPANPTTDFGQALGNIKAALANACAGAGLALVDLAQVRAHLGLAGIMEPAMADRMATALPFARVTVTDDRVTSVAGALGSADGCVASIGTGSFAGIQRDGKTRLVGGWGLVLGDEASGAWLGRRLLGAVCAAADGIMPASDLTRLVLASFDGEAGRIPIYAATAQPSDFASLAPQIAASARSGDRVARALMKDGAHWIVRATHALGFEPGLTFCLTGGLAAEYERWLPANLVAARASPKGDALAGALYLASAASGPPDRVRRTALPG